ncbi:MAG: hypothetical protein ABFD15_02170 [Methanofastidiosum sp.]
MNIPVIFIGKTDKSGHVMVGSACDESDPAMKVNGFKAMTYTVKDEAGGQISWGCAVYGDKAWGYGGIRSKIRRSMVSAAKKINEKIEIFKEI